MLDGILGRGFSAKCKSLMKTTRSRIDVVRRRAESKQRFLSEDLAKLLSNGLDINAYGRTEEFLAGMNLLWSYDFVEQSCEYIVKQLSRMQKQEDCPEECREAVASLTYAAARFSDLPELRELRDIFQQRYGSCIEAFVSQKLIEKMSSSPPPKEKRLQVLQDIASEFSIRWDSRGFERRMATPAIVAQVDEQRVDIVKQRQGPLVEKSRVRSYEEGNIQKRNEGDIHISRRKEAIEYREKSLLKSGGSKLHIDEQKMDIVKQRQEPLIEKSRVRSYEEGNIQKRNEGDNNHISRRKEAIEYREKPLLKSGGSSSQGDDDLLYCGRRVFTESKHSYPIEKASPDLNVEKSNISSHTKVQDNNVHMRHSNGTRNPRIGESTEGFSREKDYNSFNQDNTLNSIKKGVGEGSDKLKCSPGYALPPPYVKSNQNLSRPPPYVKPEEDKRKISRGSKHAGPHNEADRHDYEEQSVAPAKLRSHGHEKELDYIKSNQNLSRPPPYVKPEEDRHKISRDSKHAAVHNEADRYDYEEQSVAPAKLRSYGHEKELDYPNDKFPLPKPRSLRRKHQKSSVEDVVDMKKSSSSSRRKEHSKKGLQILFDEEHHVKDDEERMIDKLLIHYSKKPSNFDAGNLRKKSREGESSLDQSRNGNCEVILPPPVRSVSLPPLESASQESNKVFARSNTFQEDNQARHVHPKLPNYDDLAARFAALKGR